jgi:serine/threonine-protein kinase
LTNAQPSFHPIDVRRGSRPLGAPPPSRGVEERDDLVSTSVDGWLVERVVADGGLGRIYAARDRATGDAVALKVPRARHLGDLGTEGRFAREARYGLRVRHPHVVTVRGHGRLRDGRPYLVSDLYDGATLGKRVRRDGPLPVDRALAMADQLLAGLSALHEAGIVHRDVQPDNVMLVPTCDGREHVRLLDLGLSHEPGVDTGDGVTADSPGALVGTPPFMPPEQATRARAITARTDLFAAALVTYYALTGKLPFRGKGDLAVLVAVVRSPPIPLRRERRDLPRELDAVLLCALSKHPDARFATAAEMRAALASVPR